jgi:hypothetical protein
MQRSRFAVPLPLLALLAGVALAAAPAAQAIPCSSTQFVLWETEFTDCAGNQNYLNDQGSVSHDLGQDGPHVGSTWFSDLHIDYPDAVVQGVSVNGGLFYKEGPEGALYWDVEGTLSNDIAFVAPSVASRMNPGDTYDFSVSASGDFSGLNGLNIYIGYTTDVPEPGAALLLAVAFVALAGLAATRSE